MNRDKRGFNIPRIVGAITLVLIVGLGALVVLAAMTLPSLLAPQAEPTPIAVVLPTPTARPLATPALSVALATPSPTPRSDAPPTRVVVATMNIDLPIVRPKADETYPLCDVAEFLAIYSVPGIPGVTYLYAHAQKGMFLPLLDASLVDNGKAMLSRGVLVYTGDNLVRTYEITEVHRHITSLDLADSIVGDALILQTSETNRRDGGKLTVVARPVGSAETVATADAHPTAKPRDCEP